MSDAFCMPHGVCAIQDPSGNVFSPKAGYTVNITSSKKWKLAYRLACSVDVLEPLIRSLVDRCLPDTYYLILSGHWFGDSADIYLSNFLPRTRIEDAIAPNFASLAHDGMMGVGFAWYDSNSHEEIFIDDHKELTVLTSQPDIVEAIFEKFGITHIGDLRFISEHGHAHLNLGGENANYCHEIIRLLDMEKSSK